MTRILDYLPQLTFVAVSMPKCFTIHPGLAHLDNTGNNPAHTLDLVRSHNLEDIVYVGFHMGRCIIHKGDGAKNMSQHEFLRLWCKTDLCSVFPDQSQEEARQNSLAYVTFID